LTFQVQGPPERRTTVTVLRWGWLVFTGAGLGLRLAPLDNPAIAAAVTVAVLGFIALTFGAATLATRRRVARAGANWPGAVAVSASVNLAAMTAAGTPPRRRKFLMLSVTAVLLPDRLILIPATSRARRGRLGERTLPFDQVRAAAWLNGYTGLRRIPILELTGAAGDSVEIRLGATSDQATANFVAATNISLARQLPAPAFTDWATGPVNAPHRAGASIGFAVVTLIVLSIGGGYVAGRAIIAKANAAPYANRWVRPDRAIGISGYYTYGGPHRMSIQPGAPWGRPCKPIVVRVDKAVPDPAYGAFVEVVHEARAAGVDIAIVNRNGDFMPSELYPPGQHLNTVHTADVFADNRAPTRLASGVLDHEDTGWNASLTPDGHHEYVTDLNITLHLSVLGTDATGFRKAALGFVGFTQGIGVSTLPGSAFASQTASAADKFSAQDITAMLTMSGCAGISPATGTAVAAAVR
jgi:hypothetical protein